MGIGAMIDKRWEEVYTSMVEVEVFPEGVPYQQAYRLQFVNQGLEAYQA
jgi:NitT/TauT family transport system substrate-binding protein